MFKGKLRSKTRHLAKGQTGKQADSGRGRHTSGQTVHGVKSKALFYTLNYRLNKVVVQALCYTLTEVNIETLIYPLDDRLSLLEEEKNGNTLAKVECKAVLDTLAA